ncbi:hypothetical protein [Streptomyces sp. NPDC006012]|uniref:hypothetical protein n=1 Tax=Streptomyces sp. NPDC006012 TaxID=3364739 RepID=UPI0036CA6888
MESVSGRLSPAKGVLPDSPLFRFAPFREFVMADVAFVVTVIVLFALVALVARGVAKL